MIAEQGHDDAQGDRPGRATCSAVNRAITSTPNASGIEEFEHLNTLIHVILQPLPGVLDWRDGARV